MDLIESGFTAEEQYNSSISASQVKFLESAGARVVVIDYRMQYAELTKLLGSINGIYITGESLEVI
jgi:hypothetical protein